MIWRVLLHRHMNHHTWFHSLNSCEFSMRTCWSGLDHKIRTICYWYWSTLSNTVWQRIHGRTSHFDNWNRLFPRVFDENLRTYYLSFDWSGWIVLSKSEILIATGMVWPVSSGKWKAPLIVEYFVKLNIVTVCIWDIIVRPNLVKLTSLTPVYLNELYDRTALCWVLNFSYSVIVATTKVLQPRQLLK